MDEVKRIKRELGYKGTILEVFKDTMQFPKGNTAVWDFIYHKGAAAVVAVTKEGKLLLVRQYRNALERYTLELPAGAVDYAEEPKEECAARELEEETGYKAGKIEWLMNMNTDVAFCNELIGIYLATDLVRTKQHLDEDEYLNVEEHELDEVIDMIFTGKIADAKTSAAILAYAYKYRR